MTDQYQTFAKSPIGKFVIKNLGLPSPTSLDRFESATPVVKGAVLFGAAPASTLTVLLLRFWQIFMPIAMQVTMLNCNRLLHQLD
jgi:hypothetical protein